MKYILFYKPFAVLSQFTPDHPGQKTLADFSLPKNVYSVGRLDKDSEGLLLLTDDGQFKYKLQQPEFEHQKTYYVQVEGTPNDNDLLPLRKGIKIKTGLTKPAKVRVIKDPGFAPRNPPIRERKNIPTSWIEVIITEGKNRQVRKNDGSYWISYPEAC